MARELEKVYDPKAVEGRIYDLWRAKKSFSARPDPAKKPFCIVMPPPNVTGQLHMGHALNMTLQDVLTRIKRMQGYSALWLPGTDHAGIATQIKVEEHLRKTEGKTRYDYGRDEFLKLVWAWKEKYGSRIVEQLEKLGASCDWDRLRFTMDEGCSRAVREVFVNLYEKDLIYRGNRIINWCPKCRTALSDAEVVYEEQDGHFWHIRYPIADGSGYVVIATTRPETLLGDSAVAVNPEDERYTHLVGKTLILPLVGREIPVVADSYVDREFGTGCVKITPCHDPNDFEVGKRHGLPEYLILDENACIINGGKYDGMDRYAARKAIVGDLEEQGLLVGVEGHRHNVGTCYRCGTTVEPLASKQWFVRMQPLTGEAMRVVRDGETEFIPERFAKIYTNWMENIHDWCISRQLWWGHRIPAWYCEDCGEITVSKEDAAVCAHCGSSRLRQEEDVLDTWFSSALWPFSTLGWPDKTEDLAYWYPTDVLVTAYDIIFFWVARMIFSGCEHMGRKPFDKVFIHGLIRDAEGRKMSKSLGNGIDPMEEIDKYGADALRMTLVTGISPGNDSRYIPSRVEFSRNFANKLWNASRFVLMNAGDEAIPVPPADELEPEDKWILSSLNDLITEVGENVEKYEIGIAAGKVTDFVWDLYCDWYIEFTKPRLREGGRSAACARAVLVDVLKNVLKLLHPFMPFITEEIYGSIPGVDELLITSAWPEPDTGRSFPAEKAATEALMDRVRAIRNRRAEMNVPPSRKAHLAVLTADRALYETNAAHLEKLASVSGLRFLESAGEVDESKMTVIICGSDRLYIPTGDLVDFAKELERLRGTLAKQSAELEKLETRLANENFTSRAPAALVESERARAASLRESVESTKAAMAAMEARI